jgi:hypothetical protein
MEGCAPQEGQVSLHLIAFRSAYNPVYRTHRKIAESVHMTLPKSHTGHAQGLTQMVSGPSRITDDKVNGPSRTINDQYRAPSQYKLGNFEDDFLHAVSEPRPDWTQE